MPNERVLVERIEAAIRLRGERRFAIVHIDLHQLKAVNERHGRDIGDGVLIAVAARLREAMRAGDTVARIYRDRFVLLLGEVAGVDEAARLAAAVCHLLAEPMLVRAPGSGGLVRLTIGASGGVAVFPDHAQCASDLLARAEVAAAVGRRDVDGSGRYDSRNAGGDGCPEGSPAPA